MTMTQEQHIALASYIEAVALKVALQNFAGIVGRDYMAKTMEASVKAHAAFIAAFSADTEGKST